MTLAEISTGFINMPADQVSLAIQETLRRVCEYYRTFCIGVFIKFGYV